MFGKILSNTEGFNSPFFDDIKALCTKKAPLKIYLVMYIYKNKKKNIILKHLLIILKVN